MTVLLWICSLPLIAEFAIAPFNLWRGHTMANVEGFFYLVRLAAPTRRHADGLAAFGISLVLALAVLALLLTR